MKLKFHLTSKQIQNKASKVFKTPLVKKHLLNNGKTISLIHEVYDDENFKLMFFDIPVVTKIKICMNYLLNLMYMVHCLPD